MTPLEQIAKLGKLIWCVKPSQARMDEMRNAMTLEKRREFRQSVVLNGWDIRYLRYRIHHIIPISYGGSNAFKNLCLTTTNDHELLHFYIDQMNKPMRYGQRGYVWLPMIDKKIFSL